MHAFLHLDLTRVAATVVIGGDRVTRITVRGPFPGASSVTIDLPRDIQITDERAVVRRQGDGGKQ